MQGRVLKGQLTYIDTHEGCIQITDIAEDEVITLDIDAQTCLPGSWGRVRLLGEDVEAIAIDGKINNVCLIEES